VIEQFKNACHGRARLQKVAFFSERIQAKKPFSFQKEHWGPYSPELGDTLEQLLSLRLVTLEPTPRGGNSYRAAGCRKQPCLHTHWLDRIDGTAGRAITAAVTQYGYLPHGSVIEAGHSVAGFDEAQDHAVLLQADMPDQVPVPLSEEECEDLCLSLSTKFSDVVRALSETDWESTLDRVQLVDAV
jgi:hypothetical protein